jgi:hypothetical protein
MAKTISIHVRFPDKQLIEDVKRIAQKPAGDSPEVKSQIEKLAKAIGELVDCCTDLKSCLDAIARNATFTERR